MDEAKEKPTLSLWKLVICRKFDDNKISKNEKTGSVVVLPVNWLTFTQNLL